MSRSWTAAWALGALVWVGVGCHSSSHGVAGTGGAGGNAHGDAAADAIGSSGGGGGAVTGAGGDAHGNGGAGGATTGAGGGSGAVDAASDIVGASCNTLLPGAAVPTVCAPDGGAPPTPSGGTLVPGTYTLTSVTDYGYCDPISVAQTLVLTADTVETAAVTTNTSLERASSTFTIAGSNLMATQTCPTPDAATQTAGFTVSTAAGVTTLTLVSTVAAITTVLVYTKQ